MSFNLLSFSLWVGFVFAEVCSKMATTSVFVLWKMKGRKAKTRKKGKQYNCNTTKTLKRTNAMLKPTPLHFPPRLLAKMATPPPPPAANVFPGYAIERPDRNVRAPVWVVPLLIVVVTAVVVALFLLIICPLFVKWLRSPPAPAPGAVAPLPLEEEPVAAPPPPPLNDP